MSVCLFVYLCVCLFICLPVCLSLSCLLVAKLVVRSSVVPQRPSRLTNRWDELNCRPEVILCGWQGVKIQWLFICLSVCLSVCLSALSSFLSACLLVCLSHFNLERTTMKYILGFGRSKCDQSHFSLYTAFFLIFFLKWAYHTDPVPPQSKHSTSWRTDWPTNQPLSQPADQPNNQPTDRQRPTN